MHERSSNGPKGQRIPLCFDENLRREKSKIPRRSFLKKAVSTLGSIMLTGWIGAGIACKSPDGPEPPPPQQYVHEAETHARILQNGNTANGTVNYRNTRTS